MACTSTSLSSSSSPSSSWLMLVSASIKMHLPVVSMVALSLGCASSLFLPTVAARSSCLVPFLNSTITVSLPRLWRGLLAWITPPCLFVLLNGIIIVLTATSTGVFHRSRPDAAGTARPRAMHFTVSTAAQHADGKAAAERQAPGVPAKEQVDEHEEEGALPKNAASAAGDDEEDRADFVTDSSLPWRRPCEETLEDEGDRQRMPCQERVEDAPSKSSPRKARAIARSQSAGSAAVRPGSRARPLNKRRGRRASMEEVSFLYEGAAQQNSSSARRALPPRPLSPQMVMHQQEDYVISDEAFQKRIDDFISRTNAHMRSEAA